MLTDKMKELLIRDFSDNERYVAILNGAEIKNERELVEMSEDFIRQREVYWRASEIKREDSWSLVDFIKASCSKFNIEHDAISVGNCHMSVTVYKFIKHGSISYSFSIKDR